MTQKLRRKQNAQLENQTKDYSAAGYIRLSVVSQDSANSIENQKRIIENWINGHENITLKKCYIDLNTSGTTFDRKAFQEMINNINNGEINCVVMKDLSRLGRDLISTGYYIEEYFPSKNVRVVAVNDQLDTLDGITNTSFADDISTRIPLINAFNESMAVNIRKSTQETLDNKMRQGMFVGPRAPFGYVKSSDNKFKLAPDPESAAIVQKIFALAADGHSMSAIVRYLNEQSIPTPIAYARANGLRGNYADGNGHWNSRSVKYILKNSVYTGVLEQGNGEHFVKGTHEALICAETFNKIQNQSFQRAYYVTPKDQPPENILKGKVICGDCESKMQRRRGTNHARWFFFTCNTNNRIGENRCSGMYIREEEIIKAIYHQLDNYLKTKFISAITYEGRIKEWDAEIEELGKISADEIEYRRELYEQLIDNTISKQKYLQCKAMADTITESMEAIAAQKAELEQSYRRQQELRRIKDRELPLSAGMKYIEKIVIQTGKDVEIVFTSLSRSI